METVVESNQFGQGRDEDESRALYEHLLRTWNTRSAAGFTGLFAPEGHMVRFDGSSADGLVEIEAHLQPVFSDHPAAAYLGKVKGTQ
jgi:uncharacterized protein (TIGR02246 family)